VQEPQGRMEFLKGVGSAITKVKGQILIGWRTGPKFFYALFKNLPTRLKTAVKGEGPPVYLRKMSR
jgi:hypothetical protein